MPRKQPSAESPSPLAAPVSIVLTGERKRLWDDVRSRFDLESVSESILRNACESLERAAQLSEQVDREGGATFRDRFGGIKPNPAAMLERDFRGLAARQLASLASRMEG